MWKANERLGQKEEHSVMPSRGAFNSVINWNK